MEKTVISDRKPSPLGLLYENHDIVGILGKIPKFSIDSSF